MKAIRDVLIILVVIAGVIYFARRYKPPEPVVETKTEYIYDTIVQQDTIYEDSLVIVEDRRVEYDTVEIADYKEAYYRVMDSLNTINTYNVVLKDDTAAYIDVEAQVLANTLYQMNYTYQNRTPTKVIEETHHHNLQELFITTETNFNDLNISLMYKQDRFMFKSGYDIIGKRPRIGVGYKLW